MYIGEQGRRRRAMVTEGVSVRWITDGNPLIGILREACVCALCGLWLPGSGGGNKHSAWLHGWELGFLVYMHTSL